MVCDLMTLETHCLSIPPEVVERQVSKGWPAPLEKWLLACSQGRKEKEVKETGPGPVGNDNCMNNILTLFWFWGAGSMKKILLEISSYLPREEVSDLQFAPSIHPDTSTLCLSPGEQGQMLFQERQVCVLVCLFVCHRDVVRAAWFVCLFLKSPRGHFWQKAPPEWAWIRVCFG